VRIDPDGYYPPRNQQTPLESRLNAFNPPGEEGVGLDLEQKEGAHSPIPKIPTKTFSTCLNLETQTKPEYYFSRRKTLKTRKSASFTGVI